MSEMGGLPTFAPSSRASLVIFSLEPEPAARKGLTLATDVELLY